MANSRLHELFSFKFCLLALLSTVVFSLLVLPSVFSVNFFLVFFFNSTETQDMHIAIS